MANDLYQGITVFGLNDIQGNSSIGLPGAAAPPAAVQVAGSDGTDLRTLKTDATAALYVLASIAPPSDTTATGTLTNPGDAVTIATSGTSALMLQITGAAITAGNIQFQVSLDGTTWQPANMYPVFPDGTPSASSTTTTPSNWTLFVGGIRQFRVLAGAGFAGGPSTIFLTAGQGQYSVEVVSPIAANFLATVSQGTANWTTNLTQQGGAALGAATAYGTAPTGGALSVNAFVTNTVTTSVTGTVAVTQSTSPWVVSGTVTANAGTGTFTVAGTLTHNNAAPIADNVGALVALANAAAPTYTEGNQVLLSTDLAGNLRTTGTVTGTVSTNVTQWNSVAVGSPTAWGTAPTGNVIGVNAEMFAGNTPLTQTGGALNVNISSTGAITLTVAGNLTNNNAAPAANNVGALTAEATATPLAYTQGNQVLPTTTLGGAMRVAPVDEANAASISWYGADNGTPGLQVNNTTTGVPVLSIRSNSAAFLFLLRGIAVISGGQMARFQLIKNPVLTGATFATSNGHAQIDTAASSFTGGTVVDTVYTGNAQVWKDELQNILAGAPGDIFMLAATAFQGNVKVNAAMQWTETAAAL